MKILVGSSPSNIDLIATTLERLGHKIIPAIDEESVLHHFQLKQPDLIILDTIELMDGYECAKKLRNLSNENWVPILFLNLENNIHAIKNHVNLADDYLFKPYCEIQLTAKINSIQRILDMQKKLFATNERIELLSATDSLTNIANRIHFEKTIRENIVYAEKNACIFAVLYLDLNNFKIINHHFGHRIGDLILIEITSRIKSVLKADEYIARIGSDEFALILMKIEKLDQVSETAERIMQTFVPLFQIEHHEIHVDCNVGIACYPCSGKTYEALIQNAEMAMRHGKKIGENHFHALKEDSDYKHTIHLENSLRFALERNEFFLSYQPIFDLKTTKIVSMEALLYWEHPSLGLISPDVFIPLAEKNNLIISIGNWVLQKACRDAAAWVKAGHENFKLFVNVSSSQVLQKKFPQLILNTLKETGLPASFLGLELTESSLSDVTLLEEILRKITSKKIEISIDDFGIGYSSFIRLRHLPFSTLKIDKTFIKNVGIVERDNIITKSMIQLGQHLGLNVIAEGIETTKQLEYLMEHGCMQGQGFYFCVPQTHEEMIILLKKSMMHANKS